jgi:omega-hydroxy-beta-dihydromenaquinone-9 sulfotransferase
MSTAMLAMRRKVWREIRVELESAGVRIEASRSLAYAWASALFSMTNRLQRLTYGDELRAQPPPGDALFLLGFWRSGTTFLHQLLSADPALRSPTTTQCMNATRLLAPASESGGRMTTRPMDDVQISAESPQEDEFALLALGAPSIYRAFVAPSLLGRANDSLLLRDGNSPAARAWSVVFLDFLARLQRLDTRRLLLKSPTHSFRVRVIERLLPSSRFLLIHRNPLDVWHSNLKMWNSMNSLYGMAPIEAATLHNFLRVASRAYLDEVQWMRTHLAPGRYQEISYEALAENPIRTLESANARLHAFDKGLSSGSIFAASERLRREAPRVAPRPSMRDIPEIDELCRLFGYSL